MALKYLQYLEKTMESNTQVTIEEYETTTLFNVINLLILNPLHSRK